VSADSPAQRAGLRAGDVITGFCKHPVQSPREIGIALEQLENGQKPISVIVVRDHKMISFVISLEGDQ
jgi:S1-C subfamily serine protease